MFHLQKRICFTAVKGVKYAPQRSFPFQSQFVTQFTFQLEEQFPEPFFVEPFPQFFLPQLFLPVEPVFLRRKQFFFRKHIPKDTAVKDQNPSAHELSLQQHSSYHHLYMQTA